MTKNELVRRLLRGERGAISRAISMVEDEGPGFSDILKEIFPRTGRALVVGVTGPPGTGKSSLVDRIVSYFRKEQKKVAVLAVDPTSPLSGGAILGDRIRMLGHTLDDQVYIRSMASRGDEGGLSRAAKNAVRILDAAGNDVIIVETVGIGQTELDIVRISDVVIVVLMPELGDEIQSLKAGLMEIGDIFAVNKSDLPGGDKSIFNIRPVLKKRNGRPQFAIKVSAKTGEGLQDLMDEIKNLSKSGRSISHEEEKRRISTELIELVSNELVSRVSSELSRDTQFQQIVEKIARRELDPATASKLLSKKMRFEMGKNERRR